MSAAATTPATAAAAASEQQQQDVLSDGGSVSIPDVPFSPVSLLSESSVGPAATGAAAACIGGLSSGDSTPLAYRAPWATPPRAAQESNKLGGSITSPQSLNERHLQQQLQQPYTRGFCSPPQQFQNEHQDTRSGEGVVGSVLSPGSDFELHDLGDSTSILSATPRAASSSSTSQPPPVRWETARYAKER